MAFWSREDDTHPAQSFGQHRCRDQGVQERTDPRSAVRPEDLAAVLRNRGAPSTQWRSHDIQHLDHLGPRLQTPRDLPAGHASRSHVDALRHSFIVLGCDYKKASLGNGRHCYPSSTTRSGALLFSRQIEPCGPTYRLVVSRPTPV